VTNRYRDQWMPFSDMCGAIPQTKSCCEHLEMQSEQRAWLAIKKSGLIDARNLWLGCAGLPGRRSLSHLELTSQPFERGPTSLYLSNVTPVVNDFARDTSNTDQRPREGCSAADDQSDVRSCTLVQPKDCFLPLARCSVVLGRGPWYACWGSKPKGREQWLVCVPSILVVLSHSL